MGITSHTNGKFGLWSLCSKVKSFQARLIHFVVRSFYSFSVKYDTREVHFFWLTGLKNEVYTQVTALFLLMA